MHVRPGARTHGLSTGLKAHTGARAHTNLQVFLTLYTLHSPLRELLTNSAAGRARRGRKEGPVPWGRAKSKAVYRTRREPLHPKALTLTPQETQHWQQEQMGNPDGRNHTVLPPAHPNPRVNQNSTWNPKTVNSMSTTSSVTQPPTGCAIPRAGHHVWLTSCLASIKRQRRLFTANAGSDQPHWAVQVVSYSPGVFSKHSDLPFSQQMRHHLRLKHKAPSTSELGRGGSLGSGSGRPLPWEMD